MPTWVETSEIWRNYAIIAGGIAGLLIAFSRSRSLSRQAKAAQSQARIADRSYAADLFGRAVENLGHDKLEMRLGAIYTLRQLEADYPEFSKPVLMVLASYSRNRTEEDEANADQDDLREVSRLFGERLHRNR